ncbi:MAG: crossover junction endodeoxyribonuclease RuvC [Candidatus Yanofskybacteria bacterium]|nr:crossover junction endodeoxyribonuclease RuvC [Candidatus Yanofskybacteria bacterium]
MRILGIDPGTSLIGYGIVDVSGKNYKAVNFGDFKTGVNIKNSDRVVDVYNFFDKLVKKYKPDKIALESLFFFKNAKTVIKVSEIRGVLMYTAAKNGIEIAEFTPLQVKQAVASYGRAEKTQVQNMVKLILELKTIPRPDDVADALAIAICCANTVVYTEV